MDSYTFICGLGRSGGSLLANMFASHPDVFILRREAESSFGAETPTPDWQRLETEAQASGCRHLVAKASRHTHAVQRIRNLVPEARFILVVRDGRDVAGALIDRTGDAASAISRWMHEIAALRAQQDRDDTIVLRYEDLVTAPEQSLKRLCAFTGIDYYPPTLRYHETEGSLIYDAKGLPGPTPEHTGQGTSPVWTISQPVFDARGVGRVLLSDQETAMFETGAPREMLSHFGYWTASDPNPDATALRASPLFDPLWYRRTYADVDMLKMDPVEHYLSLGARLERAPRPGFDARFYRAHYEMKHSDGNPLLDYIRADDSRPVNRDQLHELMTRVAAETCAEWGGTDRTISYCIPVMGRLDDLKGTLAGNLASNTVHRDALEFLVIDFGPDGEVATWARSEFPDALADGYLRVITDTETLDSWHSGKARNAFRPHLKGRLYSSLNADTRVTAEETDWLLQRDATHPLGFVAHHFPGSWDGGTNGRVSLPTSLFRAVGYDPRLMPRRCDEIDLILGVLSRFPAIPFVGVDTEFNFRTLSKTVQTFFEQEKLANRMEFVGYPARLDRTQPRGAGQADDHPFLRDMGKLNRALGAYRRTTSPQRREGYLPHVREVRDRLIDSMRTDAALDMLFEIAGRETVPPVRPEEICLFACVKDEANFLPRFVAHHRSIGVTRFFIVDDGSASPVSGLRLGEDVHVYRTKTGDFRTSKTLWLEALMKAFVPEGAWVITADADEFLQLPEPWTGLSGPSGLTTALEARGDTFCAGLLLDMLPSNPDREVADIETGFEQFLDCFCYRMTPPAADYAAAPWIRGGFGPHAALSWRVDARYHAFGTFDTLRKIPLFRWRKGLHLNQGFHTLNPSDGPRPGPEIFDRGPILPIFHYKLLRLFSEAQRRRMLDRAGVYFPNTGDNIRRIFDTAWQHPEGWLADLADDLCPAAAALEIDMLLCAHAHRP